jgi:hypothetical protein
MANRRNVQYQRISCASPGLFIFTVTCHVKLQITRGRCQSTCSLFPHVGPTRAWKAWKATNLSTTSATLPRPATHKPPVFHHCTNHDALLEWAARQRNAAVILSLWAAALLRAAAAAAAFLRAASLFAAYLPTACLPTAGLLAAAGIPTAAASLWAATTVLCTSGILPTALLLTASFTRPTAITGQRAANVPKSAVDAHPATFDVRTTAASLWAATAASIRSTTAVGIRSSTAVGIRSTAVSIRSTAAASIRSSTARVQPAARVRPAASV